MADVKDYFETNVLTVRRELDDHLKAFKGSIGEGPDSPLPACFNSWRDQAFNNWSEDVPRKGWFIFDPANATTPEIAIEGICVNKHRDELSEEVITIGRHMQTLLDTCNRIHDKEDTWRGVLQEKIATLSSAQLPRVEMETIQGELEQMVKEAGTFNEEVMNLFNNIKAAVVPLLTKGRQATGQLL